MSALLLAVLAVASAATDAKARPPVSLEMPPPPPGAAPKKPAGANLPLPPPPAAAVAKRLKLASPNLHGLNISDKEAQYFTDHLAAKLTLNGFDVVTASQMSALIGFERQKQLLGCNADTTCMAELANALGADALVTGSIGRFGNKYQVNLKILGASDGRPLAVYSGEAMGDSELLAELTDAAGRLAREVLRKLGRAVSAEPMSVSSSPSLRGQAWIPAAAGVGLGAVSATFLLISKGQYDSLRAADPATTTLAQARALHDSGSMNQLIGIGTGALGAAGLVTAAVFLLTPERASAIAVLPTSGGVAVTFSGSLAW